MIKTPVSQSTDIDVFDDVIKTGEIYDADGNFICSTECQTTSDEIVKRINLHDQLVSTVKLMLPVYESLKLDHSGVEAVDSIKKLIEHRK